MKIFNLGILLFLKRHSNLIEDNIATCKKYFNDSKQNCIILQPANDKYSPIIINEYNYHEFKIIGKLALVISKRN